MMEHTYLDVDRKLDAMVEEAHRLTTLRGERIRLDGDGWVDIEGPRDTVLSHTGFVRNDPRIGFEVKEELPCDGVRIRLARSDNPHALSDV